MPTALRFIATALVWRTRNREAAFIMNRRSPVACWQRVKPFSLQAHFAVSSRVLRKLASCRSGRGHLHERVTALGAVTAEVRVRGHPARRPPSLAQAHGECAQMALAAAHGIKHFLDCLSVICLNSAQPHSRLPATAV